MNIDDAENNTSKSRGPRTLLMAPAQQEETIFAECTGVVPANIEIFFFFLLLKQYIYSIFDIFSSVTVGNLFG